MLASCERYSAMPAYIYQAGAEEIRVTYAKLFEDVLLLSRAFEARGIRTGDRVMFLSDNRYGWMVTDLAIMSLGAITVPRGSDTPSQELDFIIRNSGCSHLVVETPELLDYHDAFLKSSKRLKTTLVMTGPPRHSLFGHIFSYRDILKDKSYSKEDVRRFVERGNALNPSDQLTIIYTSGTTGMPKGVGLTHANIMHNVGCIPGLIALTSADRWLSILPSWHIFERTAEYVALSAGCCLVYSSVKRFCPGPRDLPAYGGGDGSTGLGVSVWQGSDGGEEKRESRLSALFNDDLDIHQISEKQAAVPRKPAVLRQRTCHPQALRKVQGGSGLRPAGSFLPVRPEEAWHGQAALWRQAATGRERRGDSGGISRGLDRCGGHTDCKCLWDD